MTEARAAEPQKEKVSSEWQPWIPKGIWGHKDPAEMTLEEKEKMLEKAKYSGPLATAYWENEIKNHNEKPDREEAERLRKRVKELEEEVAQLKKKKAEVREEAKESGQPAEMEIEQPLMESAEEELKEKKKGMGERFKDGVKSAYSFFRGKLSREKIEERPSEERRPTDEGGSGEFRRTNPGSTERSSANVGSGEPSKANP